MLRSHSLDTVICTCCYQALLQETYVIPWREFVRAQVDDGVCDELAGAVEGGLATAHGFYEGCAAVVTQEGLLFERDGAYFSATAGVDGLEFGGYDMGRRCGSVGGRFGGEEAGDEGFLEARCGCIWDGAWEVDV